MALAHEQLQSRTAPYSGWLICRIIRSGGAGLDQGGGSEDPVRFGRVDRNRNWRSYLGARAAMCCPFLTTPPGERNPTGFLAGQDQRKIPADLMEVVRTDFPSTLYPNRTTTEPV